MGLKEYRRKRKFTKTPEPKATKAARKPGFSFVVQKHYASHLHYDFRMENEGVLKSWAVPKGFPVDPKDKRLAIQVEDHPLEYKNFHGTIPEGSYGAGKVIIWDKGRYSLDNGENRKESEKYMSESMEKGHLNFTLYGKELKGRFSLIRLRNKENHWLLIKRGDSSAGKKATQNFSGELKAPLPLSVKPMLATLVNEPFDREEWIFEVKWDGYRTLAQIQNGKVRLYSRNDKTQNAKFPQVADDLRKLPFDALFDGEIVAVDKQGRPNFQMLQNYMRSQEERIIYYVFDILYAKEFDLRPLPLRQRKEILGTILPVSETVRLSDYIEKKGKAFYKASEKNGLEGIMAKDLNSPYRSGLRSRDWLKIKTQKRQEAVICGFTQPRASRKYFGALILGVYSEGKLSYAGHVGSGFDDRSLKFIYQKLLPLVTDKCPFAQEPKTNMPVKWVKPELCNDQIHIGHPRGRFVK